MVGLAGLGEWLHLIFSEGFSNISNSVSIFHTASPCLSQG